MKTVALAILLAVYAFPAESCVVFRGFDMQYIKHATVVFKGEVISYEPPTPGTYKAYVTFKVLETLWGPASQTMRLAWRNSTFGLPKSWTRPSRLLVAATTDFDRLGIDKDEPRVLQASCSRPFLLEDSEKNVAAAQAELAASPAFR